MAIYRHEPSSLPLVKVDDTIVPYLTKVKNLGVTMDCNLSWKDQISNMVSGTLSRLWCTADFTSIETRRKLP
jgi:hypothetical protein